MKISLFKECVVLWSVLLQSLLVIISPNSLAIKILRIPGMSTRVNVPVLGHKSEIILSVSGYCINLNFSVVNQWTILGNTI